MNLHDILESGPRRKKRRRVGRGIGSGWGKTATRGTKGHGARESYHGKVGFEGGQMPLYRRLPKRGFSNARFRVDYSVINVGDLARRFEGGGEVSLEILRSRGLMKSGPARLKVLGDGDLQVALQVKAHAVSAAARKKIEAAGGSVELLK